MAYNHIETFTKTHKIQTIELNIKKASNKDALGPSLNCAAQSKSDILRILTNKTLSKLLPRFRVTMSILQEKSRHNLKNFPATRLYES